MIKYILLISFTALILSFLPFVGSSWGKNKYTNSYEKFYVPQPIPQPMDKDTPLSSVFYFSDIIKVTPILKPVNKKKHPTFIPKSHID